MENLTTLLASILAIDTNTIYVISFLCSGATIVLKMMLESTLLTILYSFMLLFFSILANGFGQFIGFTAPLGETVDPSNVFNVIIITTIGMSIAGAILAIVYQKFQQFI